MKHKIFIFTVAVSAFLGVLPFLLLRVLYGTYSVVPELVDDSVYYFARMHAVAEGFWFIGNPYFVEHAHETAAAFFGADWIAAIPLLLGLPLLLAVIVNAFIWMAIFAALLWWLAYELGFSVRMRALFSLIGVLSVFWYMERPVAMQVVYPSFVVLLATYVAWLKSPESRVKALWFSLAAGATFYLYTYEWQVTVVLVALTQVLLHRNLRTYRLLLWIDAAIGVLALPMLWYTKLQLSNPWYWETVRRIGYIPTHTFGSAAGVVALQIALAVLGLWFIRERIGNTLRFFFISTGAAILITAFSNVLSGKDLETAVHIGRFGALWVVIVSVYVLATVHPHARTSRVAIAASVCGLIALLSVLIPSLQQFKLINPSARTGESYALVLAWLSAHSAPGSVVLADDALSYYIPAETKDYVVFQPDGGLYLMPDSEVVSRYLISRAFSSSTLSSIEDEYRKYAGVGNAVHAYKVYNRDATLCRILHHASCAVPVQSAVAYTGDAYFKNIYTEYAQVEHDIPAALAHYQVSYIVFATNSVEARGVAQLYPVQAMVGQYTIYEVKPTRHALKD